MNDRFTYQITWSAEDREHVGLCAEFPSLSWRAATPEEALSGVRRPVRDCVADMRANGETVPEPIADRHVGLRPPVAWLRVSERSFEFWENEEDAVYDGP